MRGEMRGEPEGRAQGSAERWRAAQKDRGMDARRRDGGAEGCAEGWRGARSDGGMCGRLEGCAEGRPRRPHARPRGDAPAAAQGAVPAGGAAAAPGHGAGRDGGPPRSPQATPTHGGRGAAARPGDRPGKGHPSPSAGAGPRQPLGSPAALATGWDRPGAAPGPGAPAAAGGAAAAPARQHGVPAWSHASPHTASPRSPAAGVLRCRLSAVISPALAASQAPELLPGAGCHRPLVFTAGWHRGLGAGGDASGSPAPRDQERSVTCLPTPGCPFPFVTPSCWRALAAGSVRPAGSGLQKRCRVVSSPSRRRWGPPARRTACSASRGCSALAVTACPARRSRCRVDPCPAAPRGLLQPNGFSTPRASS